MSEPDDPKALRLDREQARQELGETVAELTDKLDVPARAKDKVHETAEAAKYQTLAAGDKARDKAEQAQAVAEEKTRQVAEKVEASVPEPVLERGKQAAGVARRNPVPAAAAAFSAAALVWWLARRRRS
ncbi:DUF3618 domain-containing protein [Nocardia fluminea]|uniref:DUF3618 domain-containing protein n=1 Tax=Nocardia fluminea TaxID=134984 RepID=UPI00342074E5